MAALGTVLTAVSVGTTLVGRFIQGRAANQAGIAQEAAANYEADQMVDLAGNEVAGSQREAFETERQRDLLLSRQQAVAASSGGGASDPTVTDLMGDVYREGTYRSDMVRYTGADRASGLLAQAKATRMSGAAARRGGQLARTGTIIGGIGEAMGSAGSMFAKYGGTPPSTVNNYMYGPTTVAYG